MGRSDGGSEQGPKSPNRSDLVGSQGDVSAQLPQGPVTSAGDRSDGNWQLTERLLQTLNQELGGIKEYVLTELRGEITTLRSEKVQLQSEVQELRHQQEVLLSDRQQAQQQQWAQQFAQVMTQNLRQQLQTQVFGLSESGGTVRPEQRLMVLHQQMVSLEEGLGAAIRTLQQELGQHQSELSQQLLRMQDLEKQGEVLLGALVQKLQSQQPSQQSFQQPSQSVAGTVESIELPRAVAANPMTGNPLAQQGDQQQSGMTGLTWSEPGLTDEAESLPEGLPDIPAAPQSDMRLPGHPTDVASVMASMSGLKPPELPAAEAPGSESVPSQASRAAAMPSPPRLTTPVPANPAAGAEGTSDEAFIADFPIDAVRPDLSGFPAAGTVEESAESAEPRASLEPSGAVSFDMASPGTAEGGSGIVMPPGMVDRVNPVGVNLASPNLASPNLETKAPEPVSPWIGEPPTTISSLSELTDGTAGQVADSSPVTGTTMISPSLSVSGAASGVGELGAIGLGAVAGAAAGLSMQSPQSAVGVATEPSHMAMEQPQPRGNAQLQASGAAIAVLALLLWSVHYGTVQILFHGAPWIADGQGFIAATWGSALVTFWIRMLMVLPFMIVIGQGLYPPLLPEMQAVFRDRDRIPLISIAASALFFFLAHFLLYGAIATSSATPAVALFFLYPALGQFLGWSLFNQRLSSARLLATVPMGLGILLLLLQWVGPSGRVAGLASGLCYALFLMLTAVNGRRMNPMTLTVMQFGLAWVWAVPAVFFLSRMGQTHEIGYVMACALLSATVGLSQVLGLASRRRLGAGFNAVVQGTLPLVVGVVCLFFTKEVLPMSQVFGVLLVAGGAIALGFQRASRDAALRG